MIPGSRLASLAVTAGLMLVGNDPASPTYPKHWDARVAPYAKVADKKRGLPYKHPVSVRFLTAAEFEKPVTADKKLNADDRTELRHFAGLVRAFGLRTGNVDLFAAFNTFSVSGTLAYYSFEDKTITIRGSKLTAASRATLVHELTHAVQDQYFDIGDRLEKLRKGSGSGWSTAEYAVLDAIIEGDAERVAGRYRASLSAKQRRALDAGQKGEFTWADKELKRVPKVVVTMMTSPYVLGEGMVQAVAASGGNTEVDDLFRHPPAHESSLLDPFEVLAGHTSADRVDVPAVRAGEKKFDSGELGVLTWYLLLAERLPLRDALAAADGWGGDAYVAFERHGESCVRTTYRGRTRGAGKHMFSALRLGRRRTRITGSGPAKRCHRELRLMRPRYVGQRRQRRLAGCCRDPGRKRPRRPDPHPAALRQAAAEGQKRRRAHGADPFTVSTWQGTARRRTRRRRGCDRPRPARGLLPRRRRAAPAG